MFNSLDSLRPVFVFGKLCMYTEGVIRKSEIYNFSDERKSKLCEYSIRHSDGDDMAPAELCKGNCVVNQMGTLLCVEPLDEDIFNLNSFYIEMDENDFIDDTDLVEAFLDEMYCELFESGEIKDTYPHNLTEYLDLVEKADPTSWDTPLSKIHKESEEGRRRLFISQPFTGYNDDEIYHQRLFLYDLYYDMTKSSPGPMTLINQHMPFDIFDKKENFVDEGQRHFYQFCRSIGMMAKATDIIIFGDVDKSRGCSMELEILKKYGCLDNSETKGIRIVYEKELHDYCLKQIEKYGDESSYGAAFMFLWPQEWFNMHPSPIESEEENDNEESKN